ncbi:hypothetical protein P691DRAFT_806414 [Macrolepiota fuliginosa MF-IS2]|uniref:Uncharacterized protein n=1 Tax=Macrolepiota fuliginosa MF-IS2 TaxID=1400762 RepID=A0A9P5X6E4_9AGAR|nr:hypothetical protein P691DRAFT_806414 [Macrolepiota fuliginosa MF-IS2]
MSPLQEILVPDELLKTAAAVLKEGSYTSIPFTKEHLDLWPPNDNKSYFPNGILLQHWDIPAHDPYILDPIPREILLLPQSYYGLDVRSKERFQSLVPPLHASNADILVPKYHTCLEGLVTFIMNPPIGLEPIHLRGTSRYLCDISDFLNYRVDGNDENGVNYNDDDEAEDEDEDDADSEASPTMTSSARMHDSRRHFSSLCLTRKSLSSRLSPMWEFSKPKPCARPTINASYGQRIITVSCLFLRRVM